MSSILTNTSSMVALQTLKNINKGMGQVQSEISTGLRVSNAKDNSSSWSIASTMNSDVSSFKKLSESLTSASAMVGVARTAAEQIGGLVKEIQTKVVQAQNPDADLTKLKADVDALAATIGSIGASSQYNGINLVNADAAATTNATVTVSVIRSNTGVLTAGTFGVNSVNLGSIGGVLAAFSADRDANTTTVAIGNTAVNPDGGLGNAAALNIVDTILDSVNTAAAAFGSAQARIDAQNDFLGKQMDAVKAGVSALVDADMEEASARLTALQTQQQLGIQSLSIANQAPQSILSLFRG